MWTLGDAPISADITVLITPYLPVLGVIAGSILVGAFAVFNRKRGAVETRAPDVNEIWRQQAEQSAELDRERKARRRLEDFVRELQRAYRSYIWRVRGGGTTELTAQERKFFDTEPPTDEINTPG
jgi:hypothetical protein